MSDKIFIPSPSTYDAWKVTPPCESDTPYCTMHCPYWYDCESLVDYDYYDEDVY